MDAGNLAFLSLSNLVGGPRFTAGAGAGSTGSSLPFAGLFLLLFCTDPFCGGFMLLAGFFAVVDLEFKEGVCGFLKPGGNDGFVVVVAGLFVDTTGFVGGLLGREEGFEDFVCEACGLFVVPD